MDFARPANVGEASAHVADAVAVNGIFGEAAAVVFDGNAEVGGAECEGDADFGGVGVFYGIVEGFFEGEENVVAGLGG